MNKKIITIIFALAAVCGGASAQWKQGDVPPSSRRGKIPPTEIDKADVTVYYAFNASDIKDESTYIDLGWLQVGKQYTKYASYFVAHSDSTYKPVLIKNSNGESGYAGRKFGGKYPSRWSEYQFDEIYIKDGQLTEYASLSIHTHLLACVLDAQTLKSSPCLFGIQRKHHSTQIEYEVFYHIIINIITTESVSVPVSPNRHSSD